MYCKNCGIRLKDSDKFCPECGARVEKKPSVRSSSTPHSAPTVEDVQVGLHMAAASNRTAIHRQRRRDNSLRSFFLRHTSSRGSKSMCIVRTFIIITVVAATIIGLALYMTGGLFGSASTTSGDVSSTSSTADANSIVGTWYGPLGCAHAVITINSDGTIVSRSSSGTKEGSANWSVEGDHYVIDGNYYYLKDDTNDGMILINHEGKSYQIILYKDKAADKSGETGTVTALGSSITISIK